MRWMDEVGGCGWVGGCAGVGGWAWAWVGVIDIPKALSPSGKQVEEVRACKTHSIVRSFWFIDSIVSDGEHPARRAAAAA
jgi:hypothetical protein